MDFMEELLLEWAEFARATKERGIRRLRALRHRRGLCEDKENIEAPEDCCDDTIPKAPKQKDGINREKDRAPVAGNTDMGPKKKAAIGCVREQAMRREEAEAPWNELGCRRLEHANTSLFATESAMQSPLPIIKSKIPLASTKEIAGPSAQPGRVAKEDDESREKALPSTIAGGAKHALQRFSRKALVLGEPKESKLKKPSATAYPVRSRELFRDKTGELEPAVGENENGTENEDKQGPAAEKNENVLSSKESCLASPNKKLNNAFLLFKKRYLARVDASFMANSNLGQAHPFKDRRESELRRPLNPPSMQQPMKAAPSNARPNDGSMLYKQSIDTQLIGSRRWPALHLYKATTVVPRLNDDDTADSSHVVPGFAKDPNINLRVREQNHDRLRRYFACDSQIDVELLFPHINNVSNESPNKWPSRPGN
jgi:hypothetical protein